MADKTLVRRSDVLVLDGRRRDRRQVQVDVVLYNHSKGPADDDWGELFTAAEFADVLLVGIKMGENLRPHRRREFIGTTATSQRRQNPAGEKCVRSFEPLDFIRWDAGVERFDVARPLASIRLRRRIEPFKIELNLRQPRLEGGVCVSIVSEAAI